jgi:HD-GYP domain-containing protein (c-di-GMP phosphodiesterase class II)
MLKFNGERHELSGQEDQKEWLSLIRNLELHNTLLTSLMADIWDKSHESRDHGERIAELAWQIGRRMAMPANQLQDLVLLAKVHDLGKIMISDRVLNKCGPLDEMEWAEMKMHPVFGYRIAQLNPAIRHVADGILYHHERWDGQGYPHGLSGLTIPLLPRIIAAVDAFETMTHERSFRTAMKIHDALCELRRNASRQFDPDIVDKLVALVRERLDIS